MRAFGAYADRPAPKPQAEPPLQLLDIIAVETRRDRLRYGRPITRRVIAAVIPQATHLDLVDVMLDHVRFGQPWREAAMARLRALLAGRGGA